MTKYSHAIYHGFVSKILQQLQWCRWCDVWWLWHYCPCLGKILSTILLSSCCLELVFRFKNDPEYVHHVFHQFASEYIGNAHTSSQLFATCMGCLCVIFIVLQLSHLKYTHKSNYPPSTMAKQGCFKVNICFYIALLISTIIPCPYFKLTHTSLITSMHLRISLHPNRKYVRRLCGHSKCTWSAIECLSMPTFAAFVVTRAQNLPWRLWWSSQNKQIHQNLSILSSEPLMFVKLIASFARSNYFLRWVVKCWDCFCELQKTTTLRSGLWSKKSATSINPFATNRDLLEQITNCMLISCWWNSIEDRRRMQLPILKSTVNSVESSQI